MEIHPITRERLSQMSKILSASAGYCVSIEEEIEYFDPATATGWYLMQDREGHVVAYIRHFKQNSEWSLGELYVNPSVQDRKSIASSLLSTFQESARFPDRHRLRFDIYSHDLELKETLKSAGFSERIQTFRHFEWTPNVFGRQRQFESVSAVDARQVAEVLSNLHHVLETEAQQWIEDQSIRVIREGAKIVAAAQIYESNGSLEVNRFATHASFLRRGFARRLIGEIFSEAADLGKTCVYLKVEDVRSPAIAFYQSVGFIEDKRRCQTWHSRWY